MAIMAFLPREKWRTCTWCGGSGERLQSRDMHRSEGIIPCDCSGGWIKYDAVEIDEYNRRALAGELADMSGNLESPHRTRWHNEEKA